MKKICQRGLLMISFTALGWMFCWLPSSALSIPDGVQIPASVKQLVKVRYKRKSRGKFIFYEKNKSGKWKAVFSGNVWLGKKGIGKKKEGDKKTPTGLYPLGKAFGILKNPGTAMPYVKVNRYHYWCGDSGSNYYTRLIRTDKTRHRCKGEHLISYRGVYDYAIFIGYNAKGKPGKGSAIFLHCSGGGPTAGCVAISKANMKRLLKRLKPEKKPYILITK